MILCRHWISSTPQECRRRMFLSRLGLTTFPGSIGLRSRLHVPTLQRAATALLTPCRQNTAVAPSISIQKLFPPSRRAGSSACTPPSPSLSGSDKSLVSADKETSLAWRELCDHSPASYGIQTFDGYIELIPPKTPLPCKKTGTVESAFDYIRSASFDICHRRTMFDAPTPVGDAAELDNIRLGLKGEAKFKVTMRLGKDLIGSFTAQDIWTKSTVSIDFDGGRSLQTRSFDQAVIASSSS